MHTVHHCVVFFFLLSKKFVHLIHIYSHRTSISNEITDLIFFTSLEHLIRILCSKQPFISKSRPTIVFENENLHFFVLLLPVPRLEVGSCDMLTKRIDHFIVCYIFYKAFAIPTY